MVLSLVAVVLSLVFGSSSFVIGSSGFVILVIIGLSLVAVPVRN